MKELLSLRKSLVVDDVTPPADQISLFMRDTTTSGHYTPTESADLAQAMRLQISQLEMENRRLQRLSITDELTCAYNRRHFRASYTALLQTPLRPPAIALCLFDIDHFKSYNDAFGHPMGDAALRNIARAIKPLLRRQSDRLFRFGGDEFGALFCAPSSSRAQALVEQFQAAVKALQLPHPGTLTGKVCATFGIVWHPDPGAHRINAQHLYSAADNTLYRAKHEGRNCILMRRMADDDPQKKRSF